MKEADERAEDALRKLHLSEDKNKASRFLSGGTKRRLLVATVINSGARILFLDEPTTGLDPISRREIWGIINDLKKDCFIFLTTHYLDEAESLADRIAIMEKGKILAVGNIDELRSRMKYQYCIRISDDFKIKLKEGEVVESNGVKQVLTTKSEAYKISKHFIEKGAKFSINPVSLDDIFYYFVKKPLNEEVEGE
jgi:ABC-2 type transport system ATP-binding protein